MQMRAAHGGRAALVAPAAGWQPHLARNRSISTPNAAVTCIWRKPGGEDALLDVPGVVMCARRPQPVHARLQQPLVEARSAVRNGVPLVLAGTPPHVRHPRRLRVDLADP